MTQEKNMTLEGPQFNNDYKYKKDFRTVLPQFLAVSAKNLLLLGYGMTLGFSTILIPAVMAPQDGEILHLNKTEVSWIGSINLIVVPVGCALSGIFTSPLGRKKAMMLVNIPFCIAWLLFHFSHSTEHLYGALFLTGLAGGLLEAPVLTYVAEITQPHIRGALAATSSLCIIIGVFTQFLFGLLFYWRIVALINITFTTLKGSAAGVPLVLQMSKLPLAMRWAVCLSTTSEVLAFIALCFVPESPHWLISKKRYEDARESLQWLRGWTTASAVELELQDIRALYKTGKLTEDTEETYLERISNYSNRSFLLPFFLVSFSFFVGHFSGMTTLQTYAVSIFQLLQTPVDKYYAALLLGLLQIIGALLCVFLVYHTGKRPLTFFSTAGAGVCCCLVAVFDIYIKMYGNQNSEESTTTPFIRTNVTSTHQDDELQNTYTWIPMTLLLLLALISHTGLRLLPWILIGEVFSAKTRASGAGLSSALGYIFGFLTNKMYIAMVDTLSIWGTYGLYGIVSFLGCIVFYFILPETEGKTLNEIEDHFAGRKKLTNQVYRCKRKVNADESRMQELKGTSNATFESDYSKL